MRRLKIVIIAGFIAFSTACFFLSGNQPEKPPGESYLQHALTVREAGATTVKGDFERENIFFHNGVKAEMTKNGVDFFVAFERENKKETYKIEAVVGAKNVQQYIARKDESAILLPIAYDLRKNRWLSANEMDFEKTGADFFKSQKNWKADCAACHLEKIGGAQKDFDVTKLDSNSISLACGSCHAKGLHDSFPKLEEIFSREQSFDDLTAGHRNAMPGSEDHYADGSTKFAAHEYQGLLRSVCFAASKSSGNGSVGGEKINCLSCHSLENGEIVNVKSDEKLLSPQSCINCHRQFSEPEQIAEHTKHSLDSAASECYSCHMPQIVYGHLRFQRTHEISIPDASLTARKEVPNACNLCHADKSVNWAITTSKRLWSERFRDARPSTERRFDEPEYIRSRSLDDSFFRLLIDDPAKN